MTKNQMRRAKKKEQKKAQAEVRSSSPPLRMHDITRLTNPNKVAAEPAENPEGASRGAGSHERRAHRRRRVGSQEGSERLC